MSIGTTSTSAAAPSVDGIEPVPTRRRSDGEWQGMKIAAMAMTAVPFIIYNGTSERWSSPPRTRAFT